MTNQATMCNGLNAAVYICTTRNCLEHAFICGDNSCCPKTMHADCSMMGVYQFFRLSETGRKDFDLYAKKILNFYLQLQRKLRNSMEDFVTWKDQHNTRLNRFDAFVKGEQHHIIGNDIGRMYEVFNSCNYEQSQQNLSQLQQIENNICKDFAAVKKIYTQIKVKAEQERRSSSIGCDITSTIIWKQDTKKILFKFFQTDPSFKIKEIKNLYRASFYDFSAEKFHELCDGIPNTLVLMKNSKGNICGGFTPLVWQEDQFGKYKVDCSGKSFTFSITNDQKYPLFEKQYAIQCNKFCGPIFGRGASLWIYDKADCNSAYWHVLPTSYHPVGQSWTNSTFEEFMGTKMYENFTIKQWQVFQLTFEQ